jgi:hypothetical protein
MGKMVKSVSYTVFDSGTTHTGSAEKILEDIRRNGAQKNEEMEKMTVEDYAEALIADADYFIPKKVMDAFKPFDFPTKYDRALAYLAATPTSGVRILSQRG